MKFRQLFSQKNLKTAFITLFILIIISFFPIRELILRKAIVAINNRLRGNGYTAYWNGVKFKGIKTVYIKEVYVKSNKDKGEAVFDSLSVRVKILPLLIKNFRIREIDCRYFSIRYYSNDSSITDAKIEKNSDLENPLVNFDFAGFAYKNIRRFFHYLPQKINFRTVKLKYIYAANSSAVDIHDFMLKSNGWTAKLVFSGNDSSLVIPLNGKLDKKAFLLELNMVNTSSSLIPLPVLQDKYGLASGFDSLKIFLDLSARNRQLVKIKGLFNFSGFELNGERISTETIRINSFRSSFGVTLGTDFVEIDSSSFGYLNEIKLNPYLRLSFHPNPEITFKILPQIWSSDKFFRSLPEGMFTSLVGLEAEGLLHYYLNFSVNLNEPDSLHFETRLTGEKFNVVDYGIDDYRLLNGSFHHRVYERGRLARSFTVGSENPDFVYFENISPFLRAAVMTSEDGSFFYHNGFNPNAFRESIATNIKERRFARGGSTISMQLVKNVFLTRNKTLARKIEEALIVWLIESRNLVSKQRMYEVYLNIIEWGPGIYGINQASSFYFEKRPADLNLQESVFLASIVPRPRWYKYSFEKNGVLRPFYSNYFNRMKDLMVRKEFISAIDTLGVRPDITLTGNAAQVFTPTDSVIVDTFQYEDFNIIPVF